MKTKQEIYDQIKMVSISIWGTKRRIENFEEPTKNMIILQELETLRDNLYLTLIHMEGGEKNG